jgi:tight adherence protein C
MYSLMVWLALVSGALAITAAFFVGGRVFLARANEIRRTSLSQTLTAWLKGGVLRPALTWVGRLLLPFITWNQRHTLKQLLLRSALTDLDYAQIFAARALLSFFALIVYWSVVEISAMPGRQTRAELLVNTLLSICLATAFWWWPVVWLRRHYQQRLIAIERSLPFFLDMVGLGLGSGQNLQASLQLACDHLSDGALKTEWHQTLGDIRTGVGRREALRQMSLRIELSALRQLLSALIQAEVLGQGMAQIVEIYGAQQRAQRLMMAEKLALEAPIKMLFPLAIFIFPCTFLVLGFPVVVQLFGLQS